MPKVLGNLLRRYAGQRFEYDARGNLVHRMSPAGEQHYEWDAFNRLRAARVDEVRIIRPANGVMMQTEILFPSAI
nr:RHS repeat domain-containing protein [Burkholderia ubonensis]